MPLLKKVRSLSVSRVGAHGDTACKLGIGYAAEQFVRGPVAGKNRWTTLSHRNGRLKQVANVVAKAKALVSDDSAAKAKASAKAKLAAKPPAQKLCLCCPVEVYPTKL